MFDYIVLLPTYNLSQTALQLTVSGFAKAGLFSTYLAKKNKV
jgi:hypothetical protein